MTDDDAGMFDEFADAIEEKLSKFSEQIRIYRAEWQELRAEQRSTPALATQPTIDTDALVARVAAAVPPPKDGANGTDGKDGRDGKDAPEPNIEELVARVAELTVPRILALIPTPKDGEKGERGEDGLNSPEEINAHIREAVEFHFRNFHQGVYRAGENYLQGQAATWSGSTWIATRDTNTKPGEGDGWRLIVKAGRDGKDAKR